MAKSDKAWLVYRQDHDGNRDMWKLGSNSYAWGLSESDAEQIKDAIYASHTKVHGQTYYVASYTVGKLEEFLRQEKIRY